MTLTHFQNQTTSKISFKYKENSLIFLTLMFDRLYSAKRSGAFVRVKPIKH